MSPLLFNVTLLLYILLSPSVQPPIVPLVAVRTPAAVTSNPLPLVMCPFIFAPVQLITPLLFTSKVGLLAFGALMLPPMISAPLIVPPDATPPYTVISRAVTLPSASTVNVPLPLLIVVPLILPAVIVPFFSVSVVPSNVSLSPPKVKLPLLRLIWLPVLETEE